MKFFLCFISACLFSTTLFANTITLNMNFENTARSFLVHFPPGFTNAQQLPLVFNLHGLGSDGPQEEFYSRMSETADTNHFVVCYPNGIANSWNSGFQLPYNSSPDDVGFISKIIDTLHGLYNIDLNRVYCCGMSNGGFQSYRVACDLENRIAAIASVTGSTTELTAQNCVLARQVPVLEIHGTADPLVPYSGLSGEKSVEDNISFWLGKNGCSHISDTLHFPDVDVHDSSTVERIRYTHCSNQAEVWFYKITGGGHTWPNAYINWIYGPTNRDFDASQEIWNFFNRFTLSGSVNGLADVKPWVELRVSPNPNNGNFVLQMAPTGFMQPITCSVYDVTGRKIWEQPMNTPALELNLSAYQNGVYILRAEGEGFSVTKKIIKQ